MDIHKPKHPIHHARDFVLEIFTVTVGIMIALGLEGLIVAHRDAVLTRQTRADFTAEIAEILTKLHTAQGDATKDGTAILALMDWATAHLKHQPPKTPPSIPGRAFPALPKAAWDTALATQAMHLLTFQEARALAVAYNDELALNDIVAQGRTQWIGIARYGDVADLNDDDIHRGLGDLRIAIAYTYSMQAIEARLEQKFRAAQSAIEVAANSPHR